jgi:hypothetical protein
MSKLATEELTFDHSHGEELDDDDYCFIIGPDGELKTVITPTVLPFKTPKNIQKILKLYGIQDPEQLGDNTLH